MKDKFNRYCAEVMDIELKPSGTDSSRKQLYAWHTKNNQYFCCEACYDPYENLNQMAVVAQVLMKKFNRNPSVFTDGRGIKQTFRDFIESTMPDQPNKQSEG